MSENTQWAVQSRTGNGKGAARALRKQGLTPAVLYGNKEEPVLLSLPENELWQYLNRPGFKTHIFELLVDDKPHQALARDVQFHPVTDRPLHVDFLRVSDTTRVAVQVPVHVINEGKSPGLKRGGVLNVVRHRVELLCYAQSIPESITVDLEGSKIGESIHISQVPLPDNVVPTIERDFTVVTVAAPKGGMKGLSDEETEE